MTRSTSARFSRCAPQARLRESRSSLRMRANRLAASAGLRWIGGAFAIFRVAPLRQLLLSLAFLFAFMLALSIPVAGFAFAWMLIPALVVGLHAVARESSRGTLPAAALLVEGFRSNA